MKSIYKKIKLALENTVLVVLIYFIYLFVGKFQPCLKCAENKIYLRKRGQISLVENTSTTQIFKSSETVTLSVKYNNQRQSPGPAKLCMTQL